MMLRRLDQFAAIIDAVIHKWSKGVKGFGRPDRLGRPAKLRT